MDRPAEDVDPMLREQFSVLTAVQNDMTKLRDLLKENMFREISLPWPKDYVLRICGIDATMYSEVDLNEWKSRYNISDLQVLGTVGRDEDYGMQRIVVFVSSDGVFAHDPYENEMVRLADTLTAFAMTGMSGFSRKRDATERGPSSTTSPYPRSGGCENVYVGGSSVYGCMLASCNRFKRRRSVYELLLRFGLCRLLAFRQVVKVESVVSAMVSDDECE
ncbi:B29.1 [miniopterid betaherpesvirus 1]|uniref:B29.1 n=1 Tax=miniopterid betaherpesvirus 1 TaxID=3070189 RepID=I3VQ02_9BETA|nr:B29.1 [miniopterid betaherpesvirus 1]AFK83846.1 B29.1 [miniopterid betaherpesvirus 1]